MCIKTGGPIQRNHFTRNSSCFFSRNRERLNSPGDFPPRIGDRLTGFRRNRRRKVVPTSSEQGRNLLEDIVSSMGRQLSHGSSCAGCRCDGLFDIGFRRLGNLRNQLPGERVDDRRRTVTHFPLAMNKEWSRFLHWMTRWSP